MSSRCSSKTASGRACRGWATTGTDPPLCHAHKSQAAPAQLGFYAASLKPDELADLLTYADDLTLDDEIACARVVLRRLLALLREEPNTEHPVTNTDHYMLFSLSLQAARTIGHLLRDKRALSGQAADAISGAIAQALDELGSEWGIEL